MDIVEELKKSQRWSDVLDIGESIYGRAADRIEELVSKLKELRFCLENSYSASPEGRLELQSIDNIIEGMKNGRRSQSV